MSMDQASLRQVANEFVFFPNRYMHESWLEKGQPRKLWDLLSSSSRSEGRLVAYLAEKFGFSLDLNYRFDAVPHRFCLLPGPVLAHSAQRIGLALNARRLAAVIDREQVAHLRKELDRADYDFAVNRASLLTGQVDSRPPDLFGREPLAQSFQVSGLRFLMPLFMDAPAGVVQRMQFKLPKSQASVFDDAGMAATGESAWLLARKIIKETGPEWKSLFA